MKRWAESYCMIKISVDLLNDNKFKVSELISQNEKVSYAIKT